MNISLAMIVRDASATLEACLSSVKDLVDEIIIVDTGSKDNTVEIAKKFTDKVHFFTWIDDFAAARNYSFSLCTKEWILWLDADDSLRPEDQAKFKALDLSDKQIIISPYLYAKDQYGQTSLVVKRERLVRRSLGLKWEKAIHEYLPMSGSTYEAAFAVDHHKQHGTSERNLAILERIVEKDPDDPRNLYYLGKEYLDFGRLDEGIEVLEKFVVNQYAWWENVFQAHESVALAYMRKGNEEKFFHHMFESLKLESRRAEPYYHLGYYYQMRNQWKRAIGFYEKCLVERPADLMSSFQPKYYTWSPHLQLCVCYNAIGGVEKSWEHNQAALKYSPRNDMALGNAEILKDSVKRHRENKKKDGEGKKLHLGCGSNILPGYVNVDMIPGLGADELFSMDDIPYKESSISGILSEHSLEHLTFDQSGKALQEWFRVLRPGGTLELYMPDLELCFQRYLGAPLNHPVFMRTRAWFKATVFGIQTNLKKEPDEFQIHKSGYSKVEIRDVLERTGFCVTSVENYGGPGQKPDYGTPSMAIKAYKPASKLKIGWIGPPNWEAAQTRIRVMRVDKWLKENGYTSMVVNYPEVVNMKLDVAIVGKGFSQSDFDNIKWLKENNKTVFCDLCEDLVGWPWVNEILEICDKVICCSHALEEKVKQVNPNTCVIEDAWEDS